MFRLIYISYFTLHYFIDIIVVICSVKVYSVLSLKVLHKISLYNPCSIPIIRSYSSNILVNKTYSNNILVKFNSSNILV